MNLPHCILISFICFSLVTYISSRTLTYKQLNDDSDDDKSQSSSGEYSDDDNLFPKDLSEIINGEDYDDRSADSYEERQFHQRSLHSSSHSPPLTISAQTRQALIDLFQKAYDKGWRPNLKHHIPATRFGRHR